MALRVVTNKLDFEVRTVQAVLLEPEAKFLKATAAAVNPGCVEVHHLADTDKNRIPFEFVVGVPGGRLPEGFDWVDTLSIDTDLRHIYRKSSLGSLQEDEVPEPKVITDDIVAPTGLRYTYAIGLDARLGYILKGEAPQVGILSLLDKYTKLGPIGQDRFMHQLTRRGYASTSSMEGEESYTITVRLMA